MPWSGEERDHCEDTREAPEWDERDERDLIAEESAADAECEQRMEREWQRT